MLPDTVISRLNAPDAKRVYRVYVGAPERFVNQELYEAGEPVELPLETQTIGVVDFILLGTVDILTTNASGYSNAGGTFSLTSNAGVTWVRYQGITGNTFTGCTRFYGAQRHDTNATISLWVEITDRVLSVTGSDSYDKTLIDWEYRITGNRYNNEIMPPDCSVLILESVYPDTPNKWSPFKMSALGYVRDWGVVANRQRSWSAQVSSGSTYDNQIEVPSGQFGKVNLASGQSIDASENLANPLDAPEEHYGTVTDTTVGKITDDSIDDGAYISQLEPTQTPEVEAGTPNIVIQEVYWSPELWWFTILLPEASPYFTPDGINLDQYFITKKGTTFYDSNNIFGEGACSGQRHPREIKGGRNCQNYLRLLGITLSENQPRATFTSNRNRFLARWHTSNTNNQLFDVREMIGFGDDGMSAATWSLDPASDWLQLRGVQDNGSQPQNMYDMLTWGTHVGTPWWNGVGDACHNGAQWTGTAIDAIVSGQSIRRFPVAYDANSKAGWIAEPNPNPANTRTDNDSVYLKLELPDVPSTLSTAITALTPVGGIFPMTNPDYLRLPNGAATLDIRIDAEEMRLTPTSLGVWGWQARAINGTTAAAHAEDAPISYYLEGVGYTRMSWAESVELARWERTLQVPIIIDGDVVGVERRPHVPHVWEIWGSIEDEARPFGETGYRDDYIGGVPLVTHDTGNAYPYVQMEEIRPSRPLRHVMVVIRTMSVDATYAKVNLIRVWRAGMTNTVGVYGGIGDVVYYYLRLRYPANRIIIDDDVFDATNGNVTITRGTLGSILQGLAQTHGFCVQYTKDNKIRIRRQLFHPLATRPDISLIGKPAIWRGTLRPPTANYPSLIGAGQVAIDLHDPEAARIYRGIYPPSSAFGIKKTIPITMVGGSIEKATQIAQNEYLSNPEISRELVGTTVAPFPEVEIGTRLLAFDLTDESKPDGQYVDCFVKGIDRNTEGGDTLTMQQWRQA